LTLESSFFAFEFLQAIEVIVISIWEVMAVLNSQKQSLKMISILRGSGEEGLLCVGY
jgi:hypothetical protein